MDEKKKFESDIKEKLVAINGMQVVKGGRRFGCCFSRCWKSKRINWYWPRKVKTSS